MAEARLQFLIDLDDRVSSGIDKIKGNLDGFKDKVENMKPAFETMAKVGTVGFTAIAGAVALGVKAYGEAERSQRQLEHAVLDVSKGTREQVAAISDLSDALQKKSGIDGDALKMGAAQLSTFGLQSNTVVALTKSLADLTVNQNGVNASADQYVQSANVMAKALNGQFGVLEKSGIRFTEAQQNMILFGKESEKAAALQEGLAQNLRETTDTLSGVDAATAKAQRSLGEVFESLGKSFAPAISKLSDAVSPFLNKLADWIAANPKLTTTIVVITGAIFALLAVVGTIGLVLPAIITGFSALATVVGVAATAFTFLLGPIGLIILAIAALIAVGVLIYKNWDEISQFAVQVWTGIKEGIVSAMQAVVDFLGVVWEGIKAAFWTGVNFIVGLWATILDFLFPGWAEKLTMVWNKAVEIWELIKGSFTAAFDAIGGTFTGWLDSLSQAWSTMWNGLKDVFIEIWDAITKIFDSVVDGISSAMEKLVSPIQKVIDLAERALALAGGAIKSAGGKISSAVSSILGRGSSITGKAIGGPVLAGTSYMVGEKGPELFTPGQNGTIVPNGRLGGGGLTLVITGNTLLDRDAARKIGDEMVRYLKDNFRI